jgi:hypothetical protein
LVAEKYHQELEQFDDLFSPKNNFKHYRAILTPTHIPYLGMPDASHTSNRTCMLLLHATR